MTSLLNLSTTEMLAEQAAGRVSAVELTRAFITEIERTDARVRAFLAMRSERALVEAEAIDQRRRRKEPLGSLAGVPIAVKDVLCTKGEATTCGSKILEHFVPPYDATVVQKLRQADAVIVGKTNMDEFAMGGSNENSAFHPTHNPWNLDCIPGGSSGGSAACVAAGQVPLAIGTDTGGSIREPAGLCGITGLKPTYGRVSRYGLVAYASSLDQVGPFGRSAEDAAHLLQAIAGHDPLDTTSLDVPVPNYLEAIRKPLGSLRLGWVREHFAAGLDPSVERSVREAIDQFRALGATVEELTLPHEKYAVATYYVIAPCEASSNLARYDGAHYGYRCDEQEMLRSWQAEADQLRKSKDEAGLARLDSPLVRMYRRSRSEGFGAEVKRRIMLGTYALSAGYYDAYYLKALKVRRLIRQDFDDAFRKVDLIIGPITATPAFKIGEKSSDPLAMYLFDLYTVSANLAGICGVSIPCGFAPSGLPIGVQLLGPPLAEPRLLQAAHHYQTATDWHRRRPSL